MELPLVISIFVGALLAIGFAAIMAKRVLGFDEGTDRMKKISASIRSGANAYLKRQYTIVLIFFAVMFVVLCGMAIAGLLTPYVPFAFITGGFFSGLSGFVGMKIATAANARTANACRTGLNKGLRVAFSAGSVMGFTVVGLGLLDISIWFTLLKYVFGLDPEGITAAMLTFGMGASSMALFARVGGGIFTKAADVGPTSSVRSRRASPRTIPVTLRSSRIMSAITSATLRVWAPTCMRAMSALLSPALRSA